MKSKFKKKCFAKTQKGITLISLVITIVILIILAVITINAVFGENGLIIKAEEAKNRYAGETKSEEETLLHIDEYISNVLGKKEDDFTVTEQNVTIKISDMVSKNSSKNQTNQLIDLGNPLKAKYPSTSKEDVMSRRVWDMQLFNNRIYLGSGDYDLNTGPVDVYYYDIENSSFVKEATLPDEQINKYVVINDKLMITGTDPREGWELGNYFVWENNNWIKKRNLPGGVHNFDLVEYNGKIFAGLGVISDSSVVVSNDNGETFSYVYLYDLNGKKVDMTADSTGKYRTYDLFEFKNSLYALCDYKVYKYNDVENIFYQYNNKTLSYGYMRIINYVPLRNKTVFKEKLFFINGTMKYTEDLENYKTVNFDKGTDVSDVLQRDGKMYILCNTPVSDGFITSVLKTIDGLNYELELYFYYPDYSFSFEYADNSYYFGIGTVTTFGEDGANSGNILKIDLK